MIIKHFQRVLLSLLLGLVATPVLADDPDMPLHPLCLDQLGLFAFDPVDAPEVVVCDPALAEIPVRRWVRDVIDPGTVTVNPNPLYYADRPREREEVDRGFISYRVVSAESMDAALSPDLLVLEAHSGGGGSGAFASIQLLQREPGDNGFRSIGSIPGGDRCNDGRLRVLAMTDREMIYSAAATPYRLLNLDDTVNHRIAAFLDDKPDQAYLLGLEPYNDAYHCAVCCRGAVINHVDFESGDVEVIAVRVEKEQILSSGGMLSDDAHPSMRECVNDWLRETDLIKGDEKGEKKGKKGDATLFNKRVASPFFSPFLTSSLLASFSLTSLADWEAALVQLHLRCEGEAS